MKPLAPLDAAALLGIDVEQELHKVPSAALAGDWALPLECARLAVAHGASALDVRVRRGRVELDAPGARLPAGASQLLQRVRDRSGRPEERHDALVSLEREAPTLLFLALPDREALSLSEAAAGLRLRLEVPRLEVPRALRALHDGCRHAAPPIHVNGAPLRRGFAAALAQGELKEPFPGHWALVPEGDATRVELLAHGVLAARATLPEVPGLCVAVEQSGALATGLPAQRRRHLESRRQELIEQLLDALLDLASRCAFLAPHAEKRLRVLLLELAVRRVRMRSLLSVPFLPVLGPAGGSRATLLDVLAAAEVARREERALPMLAPELRPDGFALGTDVVWRLDASEAALLGRIAGVPFEPPTPVAAPPRGLAALRARLRQAVQRTRGVWLRRGREIPMALWGTGEQALATALRGAGGGDLEVRLREGSGPPRLEGRVLVLQRGHPDVQAASIAVYRCPELARVAWLALAERLPAGARHSWPGADPAAAVP